MKKKYIKMMFQRFSDILDRQDEMEATLKGWNSDTLMRIEKKLDDIKGCIRPGEIGQIQDHVKTISENIKHIGNHTKGINDDIFDIRNDLKAVAGRAVVADENRALEIVEEATKLHVYCTHCGHETIMPKNLINDLLCG